MEIYLVLILNTTGTRVMLNLETQKANLHLITQISKFQVFSKKISIQKNTLGNSKIIF